MNQPPPPILTGLLYLQNEIALLNYLNWAIYQEYLNVQILNNLIVLTELVPTLHLLDLRISIYLSIYLSIKGDASVVVYYRWVLKSTRNTYI